MPNSKPKLSKSTPVLGVTTNKSGNEKKSQVEIAGDKRLSGDYKAKRRKSSNAKHRLRIVENVEKGNKKQRYPYLIYEEEVNQTPKSLQDPEYPAMEDHILSGPAASKRRKTTREYSSIESPSISSLASRCSVGVASRQSVVSVNKFQSLDSLPSVMNFSSLVDYDHEYEFRFSDVPSMFRLREDPPEKKAKIVNEFLISLSETGTMFQLTIPSCAVKLESDCGMETVRMNDQYESKLNAHRAVSHSATQTSPVCLKHLDLFVPRVRRNNASAFASVWDIYDTYKFDGRMSVMSTFSREEGEVDYIVEARQDDTYKRRFEYLNQTFDCDFLNSLMIMERMVGKNAFGEKQCDFQGLLVEDPLSLDAKCNYSLVHLWTFRLRPPVKNTRVTSLCWSTQNHNVLAVGYGKFKYSDNCEGLVCIWNVKNTKDPERLYHFKDPVTCVSFSPNRPQILAVSFYNGLVLLMDIISRTLMVKASNSHYPLYYPVWRVLWYPHDPLESGQTLITCSENGRLFKYKKTKFFTSKKIMTVSRPHEGPPVQGVYRPRKCFSRKTTCRLNPSAEVLVLHPEDPLVYLVGTSEGCVYVCSVNHRYDYVDVFVAHSGPVYNIQFNPFCSKVFLTCGADFCVRIWAEGIFDPLMKLESGLSPVQDALWNPLHSTVIVSITGAHIEIWDIRRRISKPKSSTVSPSKSFNTVIQFSANKYNLCVGDSDGNVHVMALTEMPFSPMFQEEVLAQSIQNALISHPDMLKRLWTLGPPFVKSVKTYKDRLHNTFSNMFRDV
ncbi:dynein axonemal intermediate chain 4-like [Homalodisca vitripennis]|uniref:dynein axonemal intermediate chain 4-like n=1 Tax=Homalodisca vitripennis TaxID=197043 RepID=UPI001EEAE0A7|nr:dynein axonemal intermediate chain 4-like [Homalodisca vitripennis]